MSDIKKSMNALEAYFQTESAKEDKAIAQQSLTVENVVKDLSYSSEDSDFINASEMNSQWLIDANNLADTKNDKKINQAIYETKLEFINKVKEDKFTYDSLNAKEQNLSESLDSLQTVNQKFDFTEINKVLEDYKDAGEGILKYNKQWVHETDYKNNIKDVDTWIETGMSLEAKDIDPDKEGVQLPIETLRDSPTYSASIKEAYKYFSTGNEGMANQALLNSLSYLNADFKNKRLAEVDAIETEKKYLTEDYSKLLSQDKVNLINNYVNQISISEDIDSIPKPVGLSNNDIKLALGVYNGTNEYVNALELRQIDLDNQRFTNLEESAYGSINKFKLNMGKGAGDGLNFDKKLKDQLTDIGTYSVGEGKLDSQGNRLAAVSGIANNIKTIFKYLDDSNFDGKDYYETTGAVTKLVKGNVAEGTPEYYKALDEILDDYLPQAEGEGVRSPNPQASWTADEFGGGNKFFQMGTSDKEQNGYRVLLSALEAYASIRTIDKDLTQDITNPDNLDLD
mgnify:FL=1|jgi:hypothetical protein|tara:strand:+ start:2423 stop:3955 length:1533 start_codon:yes stop_codon:yes gene_type:complete